MNETLPEKLARIGDQAYEHRNDEVPAGTKVTRGHSRTRTLQVRLNDDELAKLEAMAAAAELPVSTVARSMLLRQMTTEHQSPTDVIKQMQSELELLRLLVAS